MAFDSNRYFRLLEENDLLSSCPSCGAREWGAARTQIVTTAYDPGGELHGRGYSAVALVCENCGLMQLHHTPALDRRLPDAGETPDEQQESD